MWLEEIIVGFDEHWELQKYEDIAEMLGRFNGAYLAGLPLPSEPWLCRGFLQSWTHECDKYDSGIARLEETWNQSRVKGLLPDGTFERYLSFCQNRDLLLASLEKLPKVFTHNDAWRPNLFPATDRGLTMIDWSNCGLAGVGEELGRYYGLSLNSDLGDLPDKRALANEMAIRYCEGLRKAGWRGDDHLAKFGFMASAGIRCGMMIPNLLEQLSRLPEIEEIPAKWKERCTVAVHLLDLAEASIELAGGAV
ncbi:phosphotransferase [Cohnella sp. GCM10012308]|uniref:phosphotransferase n=1 Tax=Cohnella sp. GCM10012308 TaxID=3317329 RepID=UPI0036183349